MFRFGVVGVLVGALCGSVSCAEVPPVTQVVLRVEVTPELAAVTTAIRIGVFGDAGDIRNQETRCFGDEAECLASPFRLVVAPTGGDVTRRWRVELTTVGGGAGVSRTVEGGYIEGQTRSIEIILDARCLAVSPCGDGETCIAGACEPACIDPGCPPLEESECTRCTGDGCTPVDDGTRCTGGRCYRGECCEGCWDGSRCLPIDAQSTEACGMLGTRCRACDCDGDSCSLGVCNANVKAETVEAGLAHTCALFRDAMRQPTVACWGAGGRGQLGQGNGAMAQADASMPVPTASQSGTATATGAGVNFAYVLQGDALLTWGENSAWQLGRDSSPQDCGCGAMEPCRCDGEPERVAGAFARVALGEEHACAVTRAGVLQCWGRNSSGRLGVGDVVSRDAPTDVLVGAMPPVQELSLGYEHTCALATDGSLWCWGANLCGQGGPNPTTQILQPERVGSRNDWDAMDAGGFHTCALANERVYCFGGNCCGQIGDGTAGDFKVRTPFEVPGLTEIVSVAAGRSHSCAIDMAGTTFCWGANGSGQLGIGNTLDQSSPRMLSLPGIAKLGLGENHSCGITEGGALYCWGSNVAGQLGIGSTVDEAEPMRVCPP